jgi:2-polyprenyl-3-methyl-5-hydroxy-6-metoxy-1,4-benzoquinol methylase
MAPSTRDQRIRKTHPVTTRSRPVGALSAASPRTLTVGHTNYVPIVQAVLQRWWRTGGGMDVTTARDSIGDIRRVLESSVFLDECSRRLSRSRAEIENRIQTALNEALVGLQLLEGIELKGKRLLEVGAGIGIVSLALHRMGVAVVAIEPGLGGFDQNAAIGVCLRDWLKVADVAYLSLGAAELLPEKHGVFDVQFSVNVLEHIPDLESAVTAMCGVLKPGGIMRHTCPNYLVPYEPHFGIPLVPLFPRATAWLLPSASKTELWQSLNFVTMGRMKRAFARHGLSCRFSPGTMYAAFNRLDSDPKFRERQGSRGVVALAHSILRRLGLLRFLEKLPPVLATPMTFEVRTRE